MFRKYTRQNIRYVKQLGSNYVQMLANYLIFFFLTPLMLNNLGQEQYGLWLLLSTVILYFSLSNFGLATSFGVHLPKVKDNKLETDKLLNTVLFTLLCISVVASLFFLLLEYHIGFFLNISDKYKTTAQISLLFFFLTFLVTLLGSIFDNILVATNHLLTKNVIETLKTILIGVMSIVLVKYNTSIVPIAVSNFVFTLLFFFITFYSCKKVIRYKVNFRMFDKKVLKNLFIPSIHYFLMGIASLLVFYSDNILISRLKGVEYIGLFAITYRLSDVCTKVLTKISVTKYPKVILLSSQQDYRGILKLHNRLLLVNIAVTLPVCLVLFFFGKDILVLWLGAKYQYNVAILRIFSIFTFFMVCAQNTGTFIGGLGIHKRFAYMGMAEAFLNVGLSYLFFQYFDLTGIALGTLCAHLLTNGWFGYFEFYRFILRKLQSSKHDLAMSLN